MECDNCEKNLDDNHIDYVVYIDHNLLDISTEHYICSPSCLVEWAWKIKEDQEKMSKSKHMSDIVP